jgi:CRISPR-associated exonuclease Cas4
MTFFRVVDLKQYIYCARLIYYHHCLPQIRPITYKMEAGIAAQDEEELRAARRSLRAYGLRRGECEQNVYLESETLGLKGQVDLVIKTDDTPLGETEVIPVDYKLSGKELSIHFKLQLAAYGLLLKEHYGLPVKRGFLYSIPKRRAVEVLFTPALRTSLSKALVEMKEITLKEFMPAPTRQRAKCEACEFRRFCNDVV